MNRQGSFVGIFVMIIVTFTVILFSVLMVYIGNTTLTHLHSTLDDLDLFGETNASEVIDDTFGEVSNAYSNLHWITVMLILGMILGIIYGSYKVRTKPIYFLPYFLLTVIAIIVSAGMSNAYEEVLQTTILSSTFDTFSGANHFMLYLPVYITIIGMLGGIIMFISWSTRPEGEGGYAYYGQ